MNIVVIIPTYNEVENIGRMLDALVGEEFPKIKKHLMKVLVVDDNSPDGTAKVVQQKMKKYKQIELLLGKKNGLGAAFARGMKYAMDKMEADAVIEMDADFQHDPQDVKRLVQGFDDGYDYVIGSRYIKGGSIPEQWEFYRKFISWGGNFFARAALMIIKIHDVTSGFKLTRVKGLLDQIDLDNLLSRSYAYKIHILYEVIKERNAKVLEVPIKFHFREKGSSKIEKEDLKESFTVVIKLFLRSRFFKFAIIGFVGFLINSVFLEIFSSLSIFDKFSSSFSYLKGTKFHAVGESTAWAAAAATEMAIISNFIFNNSWTFAKEKITSPIKLAWKFLQFNLTSIGAIVIQFIVIGSAVGVFGDTTLVRQTALVGAVVFLIIPYNYTMYNVIIWKRWRIPGLGWIQDVSVYDNIKNKRR
ncbi:MAG: hypothetical protein A2694_00640 [Candidatus Blackburnbacteria bacterium RIFCSPHIGHO2_01_FULL_40_17]|uniref:Glycosyltransferase 2-like domain-containing protein n=1 Tax=Candidatus Blackburnbacteria bacterium RIFCSPLOWO2_01_FULL_40_20 TaxID=1797519 RepID=A0A1G1VE31_9BACT|nr:MAG: hypothetical protein A2694_00640 [Candidatus Blackburnbacteria bacterium RIFCSPHIGHO2_01_FULL_40_17]OGY13675.1 MAG: hypothetical protein A3A77_01320 [Candidatus Blackburnbacteria bacterium RIFCSPLOWO2_01_FULL_40_20]OGY15095.1 MAG: hypothetical protein A3I52_03140 [Candidatus Blackburnbacteria bacterium RIFCSPLOWO2_02_FULL_40_10]